MSIRRMANIAVLAAAALILFVIEAQIPVPVPIPGMKLGLSNVVTLVAMALLGRQDAFAVLGIRLVLGGMFAGNLSMLLYSVAAGLASFGLMCLLYRMLQGDRLWVLSALCAIVHNLVQLLVFWAVAGTGAVLVYVPHLVLAGIVTGVFTGLCAQFSIPRLRQVLHR